MSFEHSISRFSWQSLSGFGVGLVVLAVVGSPVAVALPVGGTVAATAMVWAIDRLQPGQPVESTDRVDCTPATEAGVDPAKPCTADD